MQYLNYQAYYSDGIYQVKVNNRNTRTRCEICSKLTIKTPYRRHSRRSGAFIVNFEHTFTGGDKCRYEHWDFTLRFGYVN